MKKKIKKETFFEGKDFNWEKLFESKRIFKKETDRAAAIMGYLYLDNMMNQLLKLRLVEDQEIFDKLDSLAEQARIDLCFLTGLINRTTKQDLMTLKDIRNLFAHGLTINSFDTKEISDKCEDLKANLWKNLPSIIRTDTPREIFESSVFIHHFYFSLQLNSCERIKGPEKPNSNFKINSR